MKITTVADHPWPALHMQGTTKNGLYVGNMASGNFGIINDGYRPPGETPRGHFKSMWLTANKWPKTYAPITLLEGIDVMVYLAEVWAGMSIAEKETWRKEANRRRITIFAAFLKINYHPADNGSPIIRTYH